jgi:hypothetical protein
MKPDKFERMAEKWMCDNIEDIDGGESESLAKLLRRVAKQSHIKGHQEALENMDKLDKLVRRVRS